MTEHSQDRSPASAPYTTPQLSRFGTVGYAAPRLSRFGTLAELTLNMACTASALRDKTGGACNNKTR